MPVKKPTTRDAKLLAKENLVKTTLRVFTLTGAVAGIWYMGYSHRSFSWLIIPLVVYVWNDKINAQTDHKTTLGEELAKNEKRLSLALMDELPSWVNFPDVERVEWVNRILDQLWPHIGEFVETLLKTTVESAVSEKLPESLRSFRFTEVDLGDIPPRISGVKVYHQRRPGEICMDLELNYTGNINITVSIKDIEAGITDFKISGTIRLVLKPLINKVPLVGGAQICFLNNPEIDFDLTHLGNVLDVPGLRNIMKSAIVDIVANVMVLPNSFPITIVDRLDRFDRSRIRLPRPQGVVRVVVIRAWGLEGKDISILGKKTSDPYVTVTLGAQSFKTKHVNKTLNPEWNEAFDLIVDSTDDQLLFFHVFDYDKTGKNDSIGKVSMGLTTLVEEGTRDCILDLENAKSGKIILHLDWFWLSPDTSELERILKIVETAGSKQSTAVLMVFLYSARSLPMVTGEPNKITRRNKIPKLPSPKTILSVGQQMKESSTKEETTEPRWEQGFRFTVTNPNHQYLNLDVVDTKTKKYIGELSIKLKELLSSPEMTKDQKFMMKSSEPGSCFMLRLCLRILTPSKDNADCCNEDKTVDFGTESDASAVGTAKKEESVPSITTTPIVKKEDPIPSEPVTSVDKKDESISSEPTNHILKKEEPIPSKPFNSIVMREEHLSSKSSNSAVMKEEDFSYKPVQLTSTKTSGEKSSPLNWGWALKKDIESAASKTSQVTASRKASISNTSMASTERNQWYSPTDQTQSESNKNITAIKLNKIPEESAAKDSLSSPFASSIKTEEIPVAPVYAKFELDTSVDPSQTDMTSRRGSSTSTSTSKSNLLSSRKDSMKSKQSLQTNNGPMKSLACKDVPKDNSLVFLSSKPSVTPTQKYEDFGNESSVDPTFPESTSPSKAQPISTYISPPTSQLSVSSKESSNKTSKSSVSSKSSSVKTDLSQSRVPLKR